MTDNNIIYSEFIRSLGGWNNFKTTIFQENINDYFLKVNNECFLDIFISNNFDIVKDWVKIETDKVKDDIASLKKEMIEIIKKNYSIEGNNFEIFKYENEDSDPLLEGITHINVYTKSKLDIGSKLSNISNIEVKLKDGVFKSLEGFWFWKMTGMKHDFFRNCTGFEAKKHGSELVKKGEKYISSSDIDFQNEFKEAIRLKLKQHPDLLLDLIKTTLPLKHYYYHQGTKNVLSFRVIDKSKHKWQLDEIERIREICHKKMYEAGQLTAYPATKEQLKRIVKPKFK